MKKLMVAALAVATAGIASADLCNETGVAAGCSVYNVKFSLKTLAGKKSACGDVLLANNGGIWTRYVVAALDVATAGAGAADGDNVGKIPTAAKDAGEAAKWGDNGQAAYAGSLYDYELETRKTYWMDNATRTWEGVLWQCTANCIEANNANSRVNFVMWEKKAKRAMSLPAFRVYNKDKGSYRWFSVNYNSNNGPATALANETPCFWFTGRYGQKATKIAVGWNPTVYPTYGFHAAGFGTFDAKNGRMSSVSGNCVGLIAPLVVGAEDDCGNGTRIFCQIAYVCQVFKQWCCDDCYYATSAVPASGTWSIKYNASLSKGTKPLSSIIPAYAVFSSDNYTAADIAALNAALAAAAWPAVGAKPVDAAAFDAQGIMDATAAGDTVTATDAELDAAAAAIAPAFLF